MMELFIEGKKVDVSKNINTLLTFTIDDVKDFASRKTTFSKTIVLPGTANNNKIFGHIFEVGLSNNYDPLLKNVGYNFNAAKAARAYLFQDFLQTFKGTIRLLEIIKDKGRIEYEVALNGELTGLNVALSSAYLHDLDFSEYDDLLHEYAITTSWDNPGGSGVYFPLIDYGTYSVLKKDWDIRTFRPALYAKEYIDKMFSASGFRYVAPIFETTRFKRIVIPHNQKKLTKQTTAVFKGNNTAVQDETKTSPSPVQRGIKLQNIIAGLFTPDLAQARFTYNGSDTISATLTANVEGYYNFDENYDDEPFSMRVLVIKNATPLYDDPQVFDINDSQDHSFSVNISIPITLATNDYFGLFVRISGGPDGDNHTYITNAVVTIGSSSPVTAPVDYNDRIDMNAAIPQNIRQVDFLLSIVKLFNLYVYESKNDEKLILFSPFPEFFDGTAVDWTHKLDRDKPIRIKPMSELTSKIYNFNYASDSDYYNDLYKKRYNIGYGSHVFDSQFEFASQENKLNIIFASTPLIGYVGEEKIYPTIFKRTGKDDAPVEENVDSVIRIMQTKKIDDVASWSIKNGDTVLASLTSYGYAGHFDDPYNPDNDLNFGIVKELFYELTSGNLLKTQFNLYWSAYMYEITNKDSKMLTGKFYLTAMDIHNLSFQKYVYLDGVLWRLNKITDYNGSTPSTCTVELIKVIDAAFGFPPKQIPPDSPDNYLLWIDGRPMDYETDEEIEYN